MTMLKRLRWQLTGLYMLAALAFIVLLIGGTYQLLHTYFQQTTDLGLQHKMAHEFRLLGAPVPPELMAADRDWYANRAILFPDKPPPRQEQDHEAAEAPEHMRPSYEDDHAEEFYDGELSAIFVLPLNQQGELIFDPNPYTPPIPPDTAAVAVALEQGYDWRTITLENGTRVRLFTYRLTRDDGPDVLQLGRALFEQERVLDQLMLILLGLGGGSVLVLGSGSWWLAGRSLVPAQQAWERQQTFVAHASHELRSPLALIRSSAEAALRRLTTDTNRTSMLITDIVGECDYVAHLVDDLLLLSRLDAGRLTLERSSICLNEFLTTTVRQVSPLAEEQQIDIHLHHASGHVMADPTRLRQVLLILVDNALQHTPAGGSLTIRAEIHGKQGQIVVSDSGCGIPAEHLPHVFDRFYQSMMPAREVMAGAVRVWGYRLPRC